LRITEFQLSQKRLGLRAKIILTLLLLVDSMATGEWRDYRPTS